jgi:hypothetical protein
VGKFLGKLLPGGFVIVSVPVVIGFGGLLSLAFWDITPISAKTTLWMWNLDSVRFEARNIAYAALGGPVALSMLASVFIWLRGARLAEWELWAYWIGCTLPMTLMTVVACH